MYQIRKGWPSQAAIDEIFKSKSGLTTPLAEGMVVKLSVDAVDTTKLVAEPATSPTANDNIAFVIGQHQISAESTYNKKPTSNTWVGLMSQCIIECDKDSCDGIATLSAGASLTATNGKFAAGTPAIARVIRKNADGTIRINFFGSK